MSGVHRMPSHFLVVVPGLFGSKLSDTKADDVIWVDFSRIPATPSRWAEWLDDWLTRLVYPFPLKATGVLNQPLFVLPWTKVAYYGRLLEQLVRLGYVIDPSGSPVGRNVAYTFPYDWRQDNRKSAEQLCDAVIEWRKAHGDAKAWIIAHSNGGLVARWYIEKLGGTASVERLFLFGSPWDGAPLAMRLLVEGLAAVHRIALAVPNLPGRTRDVLRTFPSLYQLLPFNRIFLRDVDGQPIPLLSSSDWLDTPQQVELLIDGRRFQRDLGVATSVETLCFFGWKLPTLTGGVVTRNELRVWDGIRWDAPGTGDGTIPRYSAVHEGTHFQMPCVAKHDQIYIFPPVLEMLEWELKGKFDEPDRAMPAIEAVSACLEANRDSYEPGQTIELTVTIRDSDKDAIAISGARVTVHLEWLGKLPGDLRVEPPSALPSASLWEVDDASKGEYTGNLTAPDAQGYYRLQSTVEIHGRSTIGLEDVVIVESARAPQPPSPLNQRADT